MRMAELCAGFGGLGMGIAAAGLPVELAWYAEVDPDASTVMQAHHPGVRNVGDITRTQFSAQKPVDVVVAGWPCQPISGAGKQLGAADERWLWPDVARAVRALRPGLFVGENVPRLLTIEGGRLFGGVLGDLDALGYTVRWATVGACKVGLCHHRHRVFLVASRDEAMELDRWPLARRTGSGWETAADTLFGSGLTPAWPAAGLVSGGSAWALPADPCGDSGVALLPTPTVNQLLPTPRASDGVKGGPNQRGSSGDLMLPAAVQPARFGRYGPAVRRHELVTGVRAPEPTEPNTTGGRRLAAALPEWMLALPPGHVTDLILPAEDRMRLARLRIPGEPRPDRLGRSAALRILGNGVCPLAAAYALSTLLPARELVSAC